MIPLNLAMWLCGACLLIGIALPFCVANIRWAILYGREVDALVREQNAQSSPNGAIK